MVGGFLAILEFWSQACKYSHPLIDGGRCCQTTVLTGVFSKRLTTELQHPTGHSAAALRTFYEYHSTQKKAGGPCPANESCKRADRTQPRPFAINRISNQRAREIPDKHTHDGRGYDADAVYQTVSGWGHARQGVITWRPGELPGAELKK